MMALKMLFDLVLFTVLAAGMWWTGTRSLTTETSDHEPAAETDSDYECGDCGGSVSVIDAYSHDGASVEIYRCAACTREGTLVRHPDGHTSGRGILAEQADETIHTLSDYLRDLHTGMKRSFALLTRLSGGLTRLARRLERDDEKPCARALRCEHEETTTKPVTIEGEEWAETTCAACGALLDVVPASASDVILAGDRFECRDGSTWEVVDPWIPVETGGTIVGTVCIERQGEDGGKYWIGSPTFEELVEDGGFTLIEEPVEEEQAEEAETVAADGGAPVGGDGLGTVINRLQADFESALVWMHDADTEHLTYYGESTESLDTAVISYLLTEGFEILDAGQKECVATGQEQACVEIRRAGAVGNGGGAR